MCAAELCEKFATLSKLAGGGLADAQRTHIVERWRAEMTDFGAVHEVELPEAALAEQRRRHRQTVAFFHDETKNKNLRKSLLFQIDMIF